ncbi:hypothetical protein [Chryseobacterium caseinilyticum]|uniref:Uncharacterized protein n=1 Tax=Chryseobacterium caseinilyticum TaxID=2771428 RepID=A0ABR8Z747_9FLAO|nr:hypothetical protein [Chryseobacterium caseinilyticum]MBD8081114.1 hypothetical protein [Chryseobacterium caseinilyticum]
MKSERLYINELRLVPNKDLYDGIQDDEILYKAQSIEPYYFTPGTAFYSWEQKNTSSGVYLQNEIVFSFPGPLTEAIAAELNKTGAVVAYSQTDRKMVMYRNDYFGNVKLVPEISGALDKTQIKFSLSSLDVL